MKITRWAAAVALTLLSLINIGVLTDAGSTPLAVVILVPILGVIGLVAAYGLARRLPWGQWAALAVGAVNIVGAVVALAVGTDGAAVGLVVSAVATVLAFVYTYADSRTRQLEPSLG